MILDFASAYIQLGKNIEEMQLYLDIACASWNMSLLTRHDKRKAIKEQLKFFKQHTDDNLIFQCLSEDIQGLIKAKNDLFPKVKYPIVKAVIEPGNNNEYRVIAAFES